jgi:ribosomal protein S18 acetylase RimI-like enzyme
LKQPVIRPMTPSDFGSVYELGVRCYKITDKPYNYWSIREVADHLQGNPELCMVADDDGKVVGFALGASTFEIIEDAAHVEWIAVAPEYRRRGLGERLLLSLVEIAKGLGRTRVVADIASDNEYSQGMARKAGFVEGLSVTYFTKELR